MGSNLEQAPAGRGSQRGGIPAPLFAGFAVASIGGPIALLTLLPGTAGDGLDSAGLVVLLALAVFAVPLGIWLAFSRTIVSPGGLSAFVEAAAGRPAAQWRTAGSGRSPTSSICRTRSPSSSTTCCRRCFPGSPRTARRSS